LQAFRQGLSETGYVEGQNVAVEYRWARGEFDRVPMLAAELVDRPVNVVVASGSLSWAKSVTTTIPILAPFAADPIKSGYVASFNRPGGHITGVNMFAFSLGPKRLEILREMIPREKVIGVLANPAYPDPEAKTDLTEVEAAARTAGQQIEIVNASGESDLELAFARMTQRGAGALLVMANPVFNSKRDQIVALAERHVLPAIYEWRQFVEVGGLSSYGSSLTDAYRQIGLYTGKVLKGAKPAELPVVQTVKVELVLNLKTAKALGLTFPLSLLGRADEVIE
jgi:putative ABC transport system substrate-binding protein